MLEYQNTNNKKLSLETSLNVEADAFGGNEFAIIQSVMLETTNMAVPLLPYAQTHVDLLTDTIIRHYFTILQLYTSEKQLH